jgi:hypothetical protein
MTTTTAATMPATLPADVPLLLLFSEGGTKSAGSKEFITERQITSHSKSNTLFVCKCRNCTIQTNFK